MLGSGRLYRTQALLGWSSPGILRRMNRLLNGVCILCTAVLTSITRPGPKVNWKFLPQSTHWKGHFRWNFVIHATYSTAFKGWWIHLIYRMLPAVYYYYKFIFNNPGHFDPLIFMPISPKRLRFSCVSAGHFKLDPRSRGIWVKNVSFRSKL